MIFVRNKCKLYYWSEGEVLHVSLVHRDSSAEDDVLAQARVKQLGLVLVVLYLDFCYHRVSLLGGYSGK